MAVAQTADLHKGDRRPPGAAGRATEDRAGSDAHGAGASAHIGPNAILRVAEALEARASDVNLTIEGGTGLTETVFAAAGLERHLRTPPQDMVPEADVIALQRALGRVLGDGRAGEINRDAGARTARYLLGHRIPRPAQWLMRALPAPLAARMLMSSIGRHAWTFAGSGTFSWQVEKAGISFAIADCPYCRGARTCSAATAKSDRQAARSAMATAACSYVAATFESLFRVLVHRSTLVEETACEAHGAPACRFETRWRRVLDRDRDRPRR